MSSPRQHTPGPWHISECATQNTLAGICSESGLHITDISGYGQTEEQNQANARLIASAPDMLNLLTAADRLEELTGENLAVYARTYAALARAAIAKATGGNTPAA